MGVRLNFLVEGGTEEAFVKHVLAEHLANRHVWAVARSVYTSRKAGHWKRGGMTRYSRARRDLVTWMKEDRGKDARFTTMFDFYGLPADFPGMDVSPESDPRERVERIEREFAADVARELDDPRFVPHLQLHEFEALVLAKPEGLLEMYPNRSREVAELAQEVASFESPERVDLDHPPSKRIRGKILEYNKVVAAVAITRATGLNAIRSRCEHFGQWLRTLERLTG